MDDPGVRVTLVNILLRYRQDLIVPGGDKPSSVAEEPYPQCLRRAKTPE